MSSRIEQDSFGGIQVPAAHLWGAQTQRSLSNFKISSESMPKELIWALAQIKRAAARVNVELGLLDAEKAQAISQAADEVISGKHADEFPLGHPNQHEFERSPGKPRKRIARRPARTSTPGAPQ